MNYYSYDNVAQVNKSRSGDKVEDTYIVKTFKDGHKDLVVNGKRDNYALIQSHSASVDINAIVARARNGEQHLLEVNTGVFMDLTSLPKNINEANSLLNEAKESFYSLPIELRQYFGNSPDKMLASYNDGKMPDVIRSYVDKIESRKRVLDGIKEVKDE